MKKEYFRDLLVENLEQANVVIAGIPYDEGCSCGGGASLAPSKIRELSSFLPPLSMDGDDLTHIKLYDFGDWLKCNDYFKYLKDESLKVFSINKFPLQAAGTDPG